MVASSLAAKAMPAQRQPKSFLLLFFLLLLLFLHSSSGEAKGFIGEGTKTTYLVRRMKLMEENMASDHLDYVDADHNNRHDKATPGPGGKSP